MDNFSSSEVSCDLQGHCLLLPCVSVGNVGQLSVDLIIATLKMKRIGYIYDDTILPVVGNDPYSPSSTGRQCSLMTSVEVFQSEEHKLVCIQQRAPCVKGKGKEYAAKLCNWIRKNNITEVIILSSIFAHERRDKQLLGSQMRYLLLPGTESLQSSFEAVDWDSLETKKELGDDNIYTAQDQTHSIDQYHTPGSGIMTSLCRQCEEQGIAAACVVCFCAEGDNAHDALAMTTHLNTHFKWISKMGTKAAGEAKKLKWLIPSSWRLQFGSKFQQMLY